MIFTAVIQCTGPGGSVIKWPPESGSGSIIKYKNKVKKINFKKRINIFNLND
jgi:hypothetical protein